MFLKINWDAIVDSTHYKIGVGRVIVWNWEESILTTMRTKWDLYLDLFIAEAFAALQATIFCKDLGLRNVILEVDALKVVKALGGRVDQWDSSGMLLAATRSTLTMLDHSTIKHI